LQKFGNQLVDFARFQQLMQQQQQHETQVKRRQQVQEAFACFDRSDNGRVDAGGATNERLADFFASYYICFRSLFFFHSELIHLMSTYGDVLQNHEIQTLWELQRDGYLDYRQILSD
jgi:Ca2+-binding EF-hand superfamily protein